MHGKKPSEEGYILVAVMFLLAVLIISMAVAVPRVREDIQRDRELETKHRGLQYARAIKLYYKKFHAYPPNVDALVNTNEIRFLRKRYTDPMTGKNDWKPIMFGQNKTPLAMGFFGQPLLGAGTLAGTGPGGVAGASSIGSSFSSGNSSSGSSFSSGSSSFSSGSSSFGSTPTGTPAGATAGTVASGTSGSTGTDSSNGSTISSNQTFGGGGIIGFSPASEKSSILIYKKKDHFNEWEFLYSPQQDQAMMQGGNLGTIGTPAGGTNGIGTPTGTGTGGFMNNPGGTTTTPTTPSSPQQ